MGVKGLFDLIKKHAPEAIREVNINELSGLRLGVDATHMVYKSYKIAVAGSDGSPINHLQVALYQVVRLSPHKVTLLYVFDGRPPAAKQGTITARAKRRTEGIPCGAYEAVGALVSALGATSMRAPGEAEAQISAYVKMGLLDGIITDDSDAIPLQCGLMIRKLGPKVTIYDTKMVPGALGLTLAEFVDLCILMGCDYSGTIPNVGPATALKLIKKYSTIENVLANEDIVIPANFTYQAARDAFMAPKASKICVNIETRPVNKGAVRKMTAQLSTARVEAALNKLY
jgi:flap endonuclease-1